MDVTQSGWLTRKPWILTTALLSYAVGLAAVSSAVFVHNSCLGLYDFEPPETGPLVGYCEVVDPTHPWISLTIPPIVAMLVGGYLLRRHGWLALFLAVVLCALVIANAVVASHLHYGYFGV